MLKYGSRSGAHERLYLDQYNAIFISRLALCSLPRSALRAVPPHKCAWTLVTTKATHNSTPDAQPHTADIDVLHALTCPGALNMILSFPSNTTDLS